MFEDPFLLLSIAPYCHRLFSAVAEKVTRRSHSQVGRDMSVSRTETKLWESKAERIGSKQRGIKVEIEVLSSSQHTANEISRQEDVKWLVSWLRGSSIGKSDNDALDFRVHREVIDEGIQPHCTYIPLQPRQGYIAYLFSLERISYTTLLITRRSSII